MCGDIPCAAYYRIYQKHIALESRRHSDTGKTENRGSSKKMRRDFFYIAKHINSSISRSENQTVNIIVSKIMFF